MYVCFSFPLQKLWNVYNRQVIVKDHTVLIKLEITINFAYATNLIGKRVKYFHNIYCHFPVRRGASKKTSILFEFVFSLLLN